MANWSEQSVKYKRVDPLTGCWLWIGNHDRYGYPIFGSGNDRVHVSRLILGLTNSSIFACHKNSCPTGNRCWNPDHLYSGTAKENSHDMIVKGNHVSGYGAAKANKTHCPQGHEYTQENMVDQRYGRRCKTCYPKGHKLVR